MTVKQKIMIGLCIAVYVTAMQAYAVIKPLNSELGTKVYYVGDALTHFLTAIVLYSVFKRHILAFILLGLTINNLIDELFFNPTKLQLNELVFTFLILTIGVSKGIWQRRNRRDC